MTRKLIRLSLRRGCLRRRWLRRLWSRFGGGPAQPEVLEILAADYVIPVGEAIVQFVGGALLARRIGMDHHEQIAVVAGAAGPGVAGRHFSETQRVDQTAIGLDSQIAFARVHMAIGGDEVALLAQR